jgi:hypothetical protein
MRIHGSQVDRPDAPDECPQVMPHAWRSPSMIYRVGNGFLNWPEAVPMTNGQPNLRSCTYNM